MCSELFRIPYVWGGVPIFGVGVLMALWVIAAGVTLFSIARRGRWKAETVSTLPVLFFLGAAILFLPRMFPEGLPIRGYGVMLLAGITAGVGLGVMRCRQGGLASEIPISITVSMVITGVIGARLFYAIEYWQQNFAGRSFRDTILEIINVPQGGLVIFGGLVGAAVGFVWSIRKYRLPLLAIADIAAPCMAIGLALGRIGCFLNGCCYGGPSDVPWHVTFPKYSSSYETGQSLDAQRFSPPYADQASHGEMYGFHIEGNDKGATVVTRVDAKSPAQAAGLQKDDTIVEINGAPIGISSIAKARLFEIFLANAPLQLKLQSGKTVTISAATPPAEPAGASRTAVQRH